jgi:hypothetical protein
MPAARSMWINHDPGQLRLKFCDPVRITSKSAGNGGLWFDYNDARNLRMGKIKDKDYPPTMDWTIDEAGIYIAIAYTGMVDEFALFNRPLTAEDIAQLRAEPRVLAPLKTR